MATDGFVDSALRDPANGLGVTGGVTPNAFNNTESWSFSLSKDVEWRSLFLVYRRFVGKMSQSRRASEELSLTSKMFILNSVVEPRPSDQLLIRFNG